MRIGFTRRPPWAADMTEMGPTDAPERAAEGAGPLPIDRDELHRRLTEGSIALLDAQAPGWYERERLPGAVRALPEDLDSLAARLPAGLETAIGVYCWDVDCDASAEIGRRLIERGYKRVRRYRGGKRDWIAAGLPVERGEP